MPDLMNHEDNQLYTEILTWLNRNMTSTFQKDAATVMARTLDTAVKQLKELPATSPINAQLTLFQTLLQNIDPQQIQWRNFQILLHEKLQEREPFHLQVLYERRTNDWEIIVRALTAFARQTPV